jgi:hypothetical protein
VSARRAPDEVAPGASAHPSGVRVVRREHVYEVGPAQSDAALFRLLADLIADGRLANVDSVVVDWRDEGGFLVVHTSSYVILRGLRSA